MPSCAILVPASIFLPQRCLAFRNAAADPGTVEARASCVGFGLGGSRLRLPIEQLVDPGRGHAFGGLVATPGG